jgi:hypothetical protein
MSDSPFTRLQNLTRKPVGGISALRLLPPKLAPQKVFVAQRICFFFGHQLVSDFCMHAFSFPFVLDETAAVISITLL